MSQITGTANDAISGIKEVGILIQDLGSGASYYNQTSGLWQAGIYYSTAVISGVKPTYGWSLGSLPLSGPGQELSCGKQSG